MDAQEFTELLEDPAKVHDTELGDLKKLAIDYPYSQVVQLMYAMRLKNSSEHLFNQQLGRTSILTNDRSVLYDLFENNEQISVYQDEKLEEKEKTSIPEEEKEKVSKEEAEPHPPVPEIITAEKEEPEAQEEDPHPEKEAKQAVEADEEQVSDEPVPKEKDTDQADVKQEDLPEKELSHLPAAERIRLILERSRSLRRQFEDKKAGTSHELSERIQKIKDKYPLPKTEEARPSESPEKKEPVEESHSDPTPIPQDEIEDEKVISSIEAAEPGKKELGKEDAKDEKVRIEEEPEEEPKADDPVFTIEDTEEERRVEEVNKPVVEPLDKSKRYRFSDWLRKLSDDEEGETMAQSMVKAPGDLNFEKKAELIDAFVEKLPSLKNKVKLEGPTRTSAIDMGKISNEDEGALVTETLAKVYIKQGHLDKAIKAYRILKLKYPEKSSFFADQISGIKKLKNSK